MTPEWPEEGPRREQGLGGGGGGVGRRSGEAGRAGTGWGPSVGREGPVPGLGSSGGGLEGRVDGEQELRTAPMVAGGD